MESFTSCTKRVTSQDVGKLVDDNDDTAERRRQDPAVCPPLSALRNRPGDLPHIRSFLGFVVLPARFSVRSSVRFLYKVQVNNSDKSTNHIKLSDMISFKS